MILSFSLGRRVWAPTRLGDLRLFYRVLFNLFGVSPLSSHHPLVLHLLLLKIVVCIRIVV